MNLHRLIQLIRTLDLPDTVVSDLDSVLTEVVEAIQHKIGHEEWTGATHGPTAYRSRNLVHDADRLQELSELLTSSPKETF